MIEKVVIKRFKSISDAEVDLSQLTILIGANGTGKSNFVKALSFWGSIPNYGLATTVSHFGGFANLVPRTLTRTEARKARIELSYRVSLPTPKGYKEDYPPVTADYELEIGHNYSKDEHLDFRVARERLVFSQALAIAHFISTHDKSQLDEDLLSNPSSFILKRGQRGGISYSGTPPISQNKQLYWNWLGFPVFGKEVNSMKQFKEIVDALTRSKHDQTENKRPRTQSFFDPDVTTVVDFAQQARMLQARIRNIRRYDLLLSKLRKEQRGSGSEQLAYDGSNMPTVLRQLLSDPERQRSLDRIINTFESIAPHITAIKPKQLRTGNEFVEFIETNTVNRGIESWDSSDGTLRALALLLAIECHPKHSTVLVEEPEQNLHPWAIRTVMEHIREVIKERDLQVIITTHSQQVLERAYPEEVLVATRSDQGDTKLQSLYEILPNTKIMMGEIGDLWVQGLLGGVPSYG